MLQRSNKIKRYTSPNSILDGAARPCLSAPDGAADGIDNAAEFDQRSVPSALDEWYGSTRVVSKRMHPEWRPTASMRQKNPRLPTVVQPGPNNPLGTRAIYLADGLLRIHGTNDPASIGTNASGGCLRMFREDVEELYDMVQPETRVIVER
ncbi:hypothetical protein AMC84_PD00938 (plasmid) [Rhizobium phaseoli]|nr:L,D-transpeptidase domain-containing protein [Rhizobium phaseoli]ANL69896.1 hypothetical protein AMC84_PD00938 [Rhizobium phaseoli]ANM01984.1 L,D-transpeptidase domain-containing protein [Rhizobium phaseoli]